MKMRFPVSALTAAAAILAAGVGASTVTGYEAHPVGDHIPSLAYGGRRLKPPMPNAAGVTAPQAGEIAEGAKLFVAYNCGDCHGAGGSGAMGPSLQDNRWRFGGSPDEIYQSIAEGRPEGMPAWGRLIPREHTLKMVTYIRSLGAGKDVTTENFTGATVERSGR